MTFTKLDPNIDYTGLVKNLDDQLSLPEQELTARLVGLDFSTAPLETATLYTASFLLRTAANLEVKFPNLTNTNYEKLIEQKSQEPCFQSIIMWTMINSSDAGLYLIYLFNKGYCGSADILDLLLDSDPRYPPVYMNNFLFNLVTIFNLREDQLNMLVHDPNNLELWAPFIHRLCEQPTLVRDWLKKRPRNIKFYGGETNTILGMYDPLLAKTDILGRFNRKADIYYDLGGGFGTPEITRLFQLPFISADINSPNINEHDDKLVILKAAGKKRALVTKEERARYVSLLENTPYMPFDVTKDEFPAVFDSYGIVSTGFLTSSVKPRIKGLKTLIHQKGGAFLFTSWLATSRITKLVKLGKDVDLFTIQRATKRAHAYKTVYLSWKRGKIVDLQTTLDDTNLYQYHERRRLYVRRAVDPIASPFQRYLSMPSQNGFLLGSGRPA